MLFANFCIYIVTEYHVSVSNYCNFFDASSDLSSQHQKTYFSVYRNGEGKGMVMLKVERKDSTWNSHEKIIHLLIQRVS